MYDSTLGRFLQRDPLGAGADGLNLYAYTSGNPINGSDPSGERTFIEQTGTSTKDCKIKVTTKIDFKGEAATKENVDRIIKEIQKYWAGFRYNCCDVVFEIDYKILPAMPAFGERPRQDADKIELLNGSDKETGWDQVTNKPYDQNHTGVWYLRTKKNAENLVWTPAHEFGHLLGLGDRYDKANFAPHKGWERNIMGAEFVPEDPRTKVRERTKVEQRNIDEFLDKVKDDKTGQPVKNYCCPPKRGFGKPGLWLRYEGLLE